MSSRVQIVILLLVFVMIRQYAVGQQDIYRSGILPGVNISKKLPPKYSLNFKAESRQSFLRGTFGGSSEWKYNHALTDLSVAASRKVGLNNKIAAAYLLRIRDDILVHRISQQFTLVGVYSRIRLAHRFAADESFASGLSMEFRLRYRLTAEVHLNGYTVDRGEFYFKFNNEYLNAFYKDEYSLEVRISPLLGYVFSDTNKLEFGPDYRISSVFDEILVNSFWLKINWYFGL